VHEDVVEVQRTLVAGRVDDLGADVRVRVLQRLGERRVRVDEARAKVDAGTKPGSPAGRGSSGPVGT